VSDAALPVGLQAYFDHAAHAAPRIRDLLPLYAGQLGGEFLYGGDNVRVGYKGIVIGYARGGKVELLEPLPGSSFFDSFFARNPLGGLHHLTFRVTDIRDSLERAQAAGFAMVGANFDHADWMEAFVHPRSGHGVLVQFVQAPADFPRRAPGETLESVLGPET
jgi:methylmalonyl-CoA/ethylmalonyl-CoA epimerase